MIKLLRRLANWLEKTKCGLHFKWNETLERLKTNCNCERSTK